MLGRNPESGFLWPIARNLAQEHNLTVISWSNPDEKIEIVEENVKAFYLFKKGKLKDFPKKALDKFLELNEKQEFHIVHSIDNTGLEIGLNTDLHNAAVAFDVRSIKMSQLFSLLSMSSDTIKGIISTSFTIAYTFLHTYFQNDRKLLKASDGVFVSTPIQKKYLERFYLFPSMKTFSIPYGIEVKDLSPREKSEELREKLNIPKHSKLAISHVDIRESSTIKNLLHAFAKVAIKKPSSRLVLIGKEPLPKNLELVIYNLVLGSKVIYLDATKFEDSPDLLALADIYISLSQQAAGFEARLLEAMAQRKVIVASPRNPVANVIKNNINGYLLSSSQIEKLSQMILNAFTDDIEGEAIGESAQKDVLSLFDLKRMVQNTLDAYRKILLSTGKYR